MLTYPQTEDNEGDRARQRSSTVWVARQPIFDRELKVVAYELLYRREGAVGACFHDPIQATAEVVIGATLDIGFTHLLGGCPAFVNFTAGFLATPLKLPMGPERIVVEVLEGALPLPELLAGLKALRESGYRIALDDYDPRKESPVLLEYADIVKIDIRQYTTEELTRCVEALRIHPVELIAEKVETAEELAQCRALGFDYFQGYFLQRPETFAGIRPPTSRLTALQLLVALGGPNVTLSELETCIARDIGLSYRILRCINSSYYQMPREVGSLRQAIQLLGYDELRKICAFVMLAELGETPAYVSVQAMARARMCERLCVMTGLNGSETYFMTGLLSMLDVLLGLPLREAMQTLPLNALVRAALLEQAGALGAAVKCSQRYERGDWRDVAFLSLSPPQISAAYLQAVSWADKACREMRSVT